MPPYCSVRGDLVVSAAMNVEPLAESPENHVGEDNVGTPPTRHIEKSDS